MPRSYDEILELVKKNNNTNMQNALDTLNNTAQNKISEIEKTYNGATASTKANYSDYYEKNAVQKLINERKIEENMSNLGLTDSGLNRTQQTATQLSYANQKNKIDLAKQKSLDELNANFNASVNSVKNELENNKLSVIRAYDQQNSETAASMYNAELEAETELIKQQNELAYKNYENQLKASANYTAGNLDASGSRSGNNKNYILNKSGGLLSRDYYGSLKDNGVTTVYNRNKSGKIESVTYTDANSGNRSTIKYGVNPYTGQNNLKSGTGDASTAALKYGTYDNGYQPKGVYKNGVDYGKMVKAVDKTNPADTFGLAFNIFKTTSNGTHYWLWDATINNYVEVAQASDSKNNKKWVIKG